MTKVLHFLATVRSGEVCGYFHAGDFIWRSFSPEYDYNRQENIRIWSDSKNGQIIGFAWILPGDYGEYFPRQDILGMPDDREMLAWLEARMLKTIPPNESRRFETGGPTVNSPYPNNALREATLKQAGYQRAADIYLQMEFKDRHRLDYCLPQGFTISSVAQGLAIAKLIENRRQHSLDRYRHLTHVDGYASDLDLAVVSSDGAVASYCICWYDGYSNSGLFEPVGTLPNFRRRGLAKALMLEGIKRLLSKEATKIFVCPQATNQAAVALYQSVGFETISCDQTWFKILKN